ncbi:hypothetical protein RUM44_001331 [Polyplax serrata]|uniref:Uncharacterized protein n=1 Tax=Polyplax serrata TaxID=468196 RepID=A0ABR1AJQ5_POLSC
MVQDLTLTTRIRQNPNCGDGHIPMEIDSNTVKLEGIARNVNLLGTEDLKQRKEERHKRTKTLKFAPDLVHMTNIKQEVTDEACVPSKCSMRKVPSFSDLSDPESSLAPADKNRSLDESQLSQFDPDKDLQNAWVQNAVLQCVVELIG